MVFGNHHKDEFWIQFIAMTKIKKKYTNYSKTRHYQLAENEA